MSELSWSPSRAAGTRLLLVAVLALAGAGSSAGEEGGWLGVAVVADEATTGGGVLIAHVLPGGPAQAAGLEPDDLIRSVGVREVSRYADLSAALAGHRAGERVPLGVVREGEELVLQVVLGERQRQTLYYLEPGRLMPLEGERLDEEALARSLEAMRRAVARQEGLSRRYELWRGRPEARPAHRDSLPLEPWGVELARLTPELRVHFGAPDEAGFLVARVAREGVAEEAGVRVGDVLVRLGERPLASWKDLLVAAHVDEENTILPLLVARAEGTVELEIPAAELARDTDLLAALPVFVTEGETRKLERRIRELEKKIRELEAALEREREGDRGH